MSKLTVKELEKSFGNNKVLNGISFNVSDGEFSILLGPSGCGKSTVLRLIAGLERQDSGEIYIGDQEISELTPKERDIAMVFQSYALYPHLSVYENMSFSLKMKKQPGHEIEEKVRNAARLLNIEELLNRKPSELSGGQRQRVALGRAIVRNPKIFLFDEPLSNLDAKLRSAMRIELAKLHKQLKTTMLFVTHDQTEAMTLGEKIIVMEHGNIQQIGTPADIYQRPANIFVAGFIGSPQINLIEGRITEKNNTLFFETDGIRIILNNATLKQYSEQQVTLGIRPEAIMLGDGPINGELELIEHLGSEVIVYARVKGISNLIAVKTRADFKGKTGEPISLKPAADDLHFFYNGVRINDNIL